MLYTPRVCRLERKCTPRTLREWLACRTQHADLTLEQIAERAHVPPRFLRAYGQDSQEKHIPAATLARVCAVIGDFSGFDLLLEPHGLRLVTLGATSSKSLEAEALDVAAASGDLVSGVRTALVDGQVDDDERAGLQSRIRELHREADELSARLDRNPVVRFHQERA